MSIDQTDIIDAIGVDNVTGQVVLTISDHLKWDKNHFLLLQEKLNTYLRFIESGELLDSYSDSKNREVLINIVCKYSPNESAKAFLHKVSEIVEGSGIRFKCQIF